MRPPAPFAIVPALLLCCVGFCQRVNSQTKPAKKNPDGTISGKVTIKGKPAAGVVVGVRSIQPAQFDPTFKATTDQDGNYRINDVPIGSYEVAPVAPALVIADVNYSRGQTVAITEGEDAEGIDFEMLPGGVITGKVTDADGHPIVEERVNLVRVDQRNQRVPDYPHSFQTDDRGIYRMFGIRPGQYKVSIGRGENTYGGPGWGRPSYRTTFYPDATDPVKATVIEIDEGTEATKIDITLTPPVQGYSVSGRVVEESGKPFPNAAIGLSRITIVDAGNSSSTGVSTGVRSDSQGDFRLENLPPGKYSISIYPPPESDLRTEPVTFDVLDQDVTGLLIKCSNGASLAGIVVLEAAKDKSAAARLFQSYVYVSVYVRNNNTSSGRTVEMNSDGSFRVGGLEAGTVNLSLGGDATREFVISRIELDGIAVDSSGLRIQNGEQVTGITIFVAHNNGSIRGVVKLENGTLPSGGRLFIQLTKAGNAISGAQTTVADSRGHFLIQGLAGGDYDLTIVAYAPESRQKPTTVKQRVSVTEGAATEVTVTLDLTQIPNP